jgi:environmental stress-induced protein Ves
VTWQVVQLIDVPPSPWRNGGGVTHELVAWPRHDDWSWRVSVADVDQSGPFSKFDGVQRWFAVLAGAGVRLAMGPHGCEHEQTYALTDSSAPLCFAGEQPVACTLIDGSTQDFNLMLRRDKAVALMKRVGGAASMILDAPRTVAIYAASVATTVFLQPDSLLLTAHSLAWQTLPAGTAVRVESTDALWLEIEVVP